MDVLIVGHGEVGKSVQKVVEASGKHRVFTRDIEDVAIGGELGVMHICIPFSEGFVKAVAGYVSKYKPKLTIIESTVYPGTTEEVHKESGGLLVHSPVRGRHPNIDEGILKFVKFIGPVSKEAGEMALEYYNGLGLKAEVLNSPRETELGKLLSTTYYAVNIAFHQEMDRMCDHFGAEFKQAVSRFNATCTMDKEHKVPRPVMYPGVIGGHCLLPNIDILKKGVESEFLDMILKSNELTKKKLEKD